MHELLDHGRTVELSIIQVTSIKGGIATMIKTLDQKTVETHSTTDDQKNVTWTTATGFVMVNILMVVNGLTVVM